MAKKKKTKISGGRRHGVVRRVVKGGSGSIRLTGFYTERSNGRRRFYANLLLKVPTMHFDEDGRSNRSHETVAVSWPMTREIYRRLRGAYASAVKEGRQGLTIDDVEFEADFRGVR